MNDTMIIRGSGGKKGGGGGSGAVEDPDSLRSRQYARVLDLISEGEIEGLVDGLKSIYLDGTPLQNADDSFNFQNVVVATRNGTQIQDYIPGFPAVESEIGVSVEVTNSTSVTRTVSDPNVDAVRVTLTFPQLTEQDTKKGDMHGSSASIAIDVQSAGSGFVEALADTVVGKATSPYQRSYRINLTGSAPWDIRVRRVSPDSTSVAIANKTYWASYTEIIDQKLSYPNSALVGISIDASQFQSIPSRGYDVKLLKVRLPSNYDPVTRTYTGVWDGSFQPAAWTDNPAWCWYDLVTNERYGLGEFVDASLVDKWAIYTIGKYCDELVPDGFGGMEPRFTCNMYLQTREEAYKVVNSLASIFRGMAYWAGGGMTATYDHPSDPIAQFTPANVKDGQFTYSGTALKTRHTVAMVTWNDPANEYKQTVEYVEDEAGIRRYGIVQTDVVAVGCTSRGQAHRVGKWILYTERKETEVVSFVTGLEGAAVYPGSVIRTQTPSRAGIRLGGRLMAATTTSLTLDAPVTIEAGKTYTVSAVLSDGTLVDRVITNGAGQVSVLSLATALPSAPEKHSIWVLTVNDLVPELWRVISVSEKEKHQREIVAVEHHPEKYLEVEEGIILEPAPTSTIPTTSPPPTNLLVSSHIGEHGLLELTVSWDAAEGTRASQVLWRKGSDNYESAVVYSNTHTIRGVSIGQYSIMVSTVNALGTPSPKATITYNVVSASVLPDVENLALSQPFTNTFAAVKWDDVPTSDGYRVQIVVSGVVKRDTTTRAPHYEYKYEDSVADGAGTPFRSFDIRVKVLYGTLESGNWATLSVSNAAPAAPAATVTAITGGVQVSAPLPADTDYAGMMVWVSTVNGFTPGPSYLKYQGLNNSANILNLTAGVPHYVRVAFYDVFGSTGLNTTSQYTVTPLSNSADLPVVSTLPAAGNEGKVVYLTTDDKLYRDNGTSWVTWVDGSDLLASSVTAGKISVTTLSALSASMGTLTSGNITIDNAGFIRGGSTGYLTGTGWWQGYHSGAYKFHIGNPTGDYMAWTGTGLVVQSTQLTLNSSGLTISTPQFSLSGGSATFSGALSAASGTFAGSLSGATGTFSGSLTASAINAVDTINLAGNAVTVPASAYRGASMQQTGGNAGGHPYYLGVYDLLSVGLGTISGAPVYLAASFSADPQYASYLGAGVLQLLRDGGLLYETDFLVETQSSNMTYSISMTDYPAPGNHTYTFRLRKGMNDWVPIKSASLFALHVKK